MQQLFFCHIPKTAGTSLARTLEKAFSGDMVQPTRKAITDNGGQYPGANAFLNDLPSARLVRGHYHLSFRDWLADPIDIVVLRAPLERAQSHFRHVIRERPGQRDALLEQLDAGKCVIPDNVMTRMLGGHLKDSGTTNLQTAQREMMYSPIQDRAALLSSAKEALLTVKILGFTEHLADLSVKLKEIGISYDSDLHANKTPPLELSPRQLDTLEKSNTLDQQLYEFALGAILENS